MARINIFAGNFGSGKTEISINYAIKKKRDGKSKKVAVVDMDVVNPYFRSREAQKKLENQGIEVIFPEGLLANADLPIISPVIYKVLQQKSYQVIFDVGGDDVGATVLGSLQKYFQEDSVEFNLVVNPYRPFTKDLGGIKNIKEEVENASRLQFESMIANPNLGDETTVEILQEGYNKVLEFSRYFDLPIKFTVVMEELKDKISLPGEIFILKRFMRPPW